MSLSLLPEDAVQNGPEPSRARRCWARRSEPLTARTVLGRWTHRERLGEMLAKSAGVKMAPSPGATDSHGAMVIGRTIANAETAGKPVERPRRVGGPIAHSCQHEALYYAGEMAIKRVSEAPTASESLSRTASLAGRLCPESRTV